MAERTANRNQRGTAANNPGIALALLGERENSADSLEQALAAICGAREVFIDEAGLLHHQPVFDQRIAAIEHVLAETRRA